MSEAQKLLQQKSNEWYTPSRYIEAARAVMGSIDLDPASCEFANRTVQASCYYSKEDDGLSKPWYGNVWLNPPYGRTNAEKGAHKSTIGLFTTKLLQCYLDGVINQAVLLVPATIGTSWFHPLWQLPICFHTGKLNFKSPEKHSCYSHAYGTILTYLGPNETAFVNTFSEFGTIAKRVNTPPARIHTLGLWEVTGYERENIQSKEEA